ncbi:uncharacterized protein LOC123430827 [Hordeum vulgare subsp. vulgare]|uniref:Pectinesterase inhibitor domain-containing protein n=1 Tax=Hordeum vulgare subsp. vulgare TaxID=112509 RepID=A0A8I7B3W6_HORVV|nr:uncharacterized protein LOC123430827 [Hordeum vulgare subsp. vulgare]
MRPSQALSHLVLLLVLTSSRASVLEETCRLYGGDRYEYPHTYDYCIRFFRASKDSAAADKHGLIFIAMNTRRRIAALKAGGKDKKIQASLAACDQLYSSAVGRIDEAARVISSGKLFDALTSLGNNLAVGYNCEEQFRKTGVRYPLAEEEYDFFNESVFTKDLTARLWY